MNKMTDKMQKIYERKFVPLYNKGKYEEAYKLCSENKEIIDYFSEEERSTILKMVIDKFGKASKKFKEDLELINFKYNHTN